MRSIRDVEDESLRLQIQILAARQLEDFIQKTGLRPTYRFVVKAENESGAEEEFEVPITIG